MIHYSIEEVEKNPELSGRFQYKCKVAKGFRYRFQFSWEDRLIVDKAKKCGNLFNTSKAGRETNYVEVLEEGHKTANEDFQSEHNPDNYDVTALDRQGSNYSMTDYSEPTLSKANTYNKNDVDEEMRIKMGQVSFDKRAKVSVFLLYSFVMLSLDC